MALPSVYINLEDDVSKIAIRLRRQTSKQVVLVCPKRCQLFADSINLRLLKKQADLIGKEVFILTMDERGQMYAKEAGFGLKFLPKVSGNRAVSDVHFQQKPKVETWRPQTEQEEPAEKVEDEAEEEVQSQPVKVAAPVISSMLKKKLEQPVQEFLETAQADEPEETEEEPAEKDELQEEPEFTESEYILPQEPIPPVEVKENFFPSEIHNEYKGDKKHSGITKIILGLLFLTAIITAALVFVILPKATVVVFPKTEIVTRDMKISLSSVVQTPDANKLILPAVKVDQTVNVADKFQSQGQNQVGNKATGTIKIYNFTKVPINLKAGTTVLTVGSKTYSLDNDVLGLKPTEYLNARTKEVDLSSLGQPVDVTASQGGDDYNLPGGTRMEISNQVFGSRPQLLYAKTDSEISGGTTRYLSVISSDDITQAQAKLQKEALDQVRQKLSLSGQILADGAYSATVSQFGTDNQPGVQTPSFQGSLTVQITGLAFKLDDLNNLINERISQTLSANKSLEKPSLDQIQYSAQELDLNNQLAVLSAHFQGKAVYNLDLKGVTPEMVGKSQAQVNDILNKRGEIEKVEITLAPVWQKNFPWLASKINLIVNTDSSN